MIKKAFFGFQELIPLFQFFSNLSVVIGKERRRSGERRGTRTSNPYSSTFAIDSVCTPDGSEVLSSPSQSRRKSYIL